MTQAETLSVHPLRNRKPLLSTTETCNRCIIFCQPAQNVLVVLEVVVGRSRRFVMSHSSDASSTLRKALLLSVFHFRNCRCITMVGCAWTCRHQWTEMAPGGSTVTSSIISPVFVNTRSMVPPSTCDGTAGNAECNENWT